MESTNPCAATTFSAPQPLRRCSPYVLFATPLLYARESIVEKDLRVLSLLRVVLGARNARRDESRGRAGLPPAAVFAVSYWGAGWFVQVMLLLSVVAFTVWWAWFRSIEAFIGSGLWMFVAVQVAAAAAWPMLAYLVSLPFKSADFFSVTASLLSTFYLFPFLFVIFLSSSMSGSFLLWHLVFSFTIPFYGLPAVFYFMVMAYANNEGTTLPVSYYFEWTNHMLPALLGIISHFLIGAIALVVYEFSGGSIWRPRRAAPPAGANEDSDVKQERRRLEPVVRGGVLDTFGITMKDLHKSFVVLATDPAKVSSDDSSAAPADEEAHHHPPTPPAPLETSGPFDLWKNRVALQSLTLGVPRGELFTLLGPNGAGKTTALSMALAELQPDAGDVWLNAPRGVGYAPQQEAVWPLLSVREHLTFYAGLKGLGHLQSKKWAEKAARELGLVEALDKRVKDTSGGMKRKLGFALAIVGAVDVLFLDEPSTGIDPAARLVMRNFLQARQQQFSTLLTTHSMDEADTLSTRIGILVNGALACIGSPGHLKRRFGNSYVLELVFAASDDSAASTPAAPASAWLARAFPGARSLELFDGVVARWEVPVADVAAAGGLARCFAMLEAWRAAAGRSSAHPPASAALWRGPPIVDYSLGMTSLEMIFMRFARGQVQSEVP
ncbi:P-loop containing nucleoside triphosphate hydrolase protein [Zopfochytrium polystomum]|nr:P-loop containing nucleoside triphosphate hydrolase protein [Zopfochytrium polystomum]